MGSRDEARHLGDPLQTFRTPPASTSDPFQGDLLYLGLVIEKGDPLSEDQIRGARLAITHANTAAGGEDPLFDLVVGEVKGPWSSAAEACRDLIYENQCLGILSPSSGQVAHLLAQIATRGRVPIVTLSAERSLTSIPVPWLFRVVPDSRSEIRALLADLEPSRRAQHIPAIVPPGRRGRLLRADLEAVARETGLSLTPFSTGSLREAKRFPEGDSVLLLLASGREARQDVESLYDRGWRGTILAGRAAREGDRDAVVRERPGLEVLSTGVLDARPTVSRFVTEYRRQFAREPGEAAAFAYDAATLLITAVREVGCDRSAVRDWLASRKGFHTVTGLTSFDGTGNRVGPLSLLSGGPVSKAPPGGEATGPSLPESRFLGRPHGAAALPPAAVRGRGDHTMENN